MAAQAASTFPSILLVDGVTPGTSSSGLFSFLDPIISQNVPVSIVVKFDDEEWKNPGTTADLMRLLSRLIVDYPGLVDLALELPELASLHAYLRMRSASEARNWFRRSLLVATGKEAPAAAPQTIVSRLPSGQTPVIEGLRSAGILNSILLPQVGTTLEIWRNSDGTQQINGGWRLPPSPTSEEITATFSKATSSEGPMVFAAKFPNDSLKGDEELFDQGAILGDAFRQNLISSRNYLILPSELKFRSGAVFSRHLVLCIHADDSSASTDSLGARLAAAGVPFTEIKRSFEIARQESDAASTETGEHELRACFEISSTDDDKWQKARHLAFGSIAPASEHSTVGLAACAALGDGNDPSANQGEHAGFEIVLDLSKGGERFSGFDEYGALRVNASLVLDGPHAGLSAQTLRERIDDAASPSDRCCAVD